MARLRLSSPLRTIRRTKLVRSAIRRLAGPPGEHLRAKRL
jgi:hypothetical protein